MKSFGLFLEAVEDECPNCEGVGGWVWGDALAIYGDPCTACDATGLRLVFTSERKAENSNPKP